MQKAVLVAYGEYNNEYHFCKDDYIVAIDGGYSYLKKQKIKPNLFIGDNDSNKLAIDKNVKKIILPEEKDDTDSLYAIKTCLKLGFDRFELYGFLGKEFSHSLANIQVLLYLKKKRVEAKIIEKNKTYIILHNEKIKLKKDGKLTLLSLSNKSKVSLKNLKYPLKKSILSNDFPLGIDNEFIDKEAEITIHNGYVLLIY